MINFEEEPKIYNAKIKFTFLGPIDNFNGMWWQIGFEYEKGVTATNKVQLTDTNKIKDILNTLEVRSWEELQRKYARIKVKDKVVVAFGNVIENRWVVVQ